MTTRDFVPLTQYTELKNNFLKLNDRRNKLEIGNAKLKTDCKTIAQKLLQVKPELREWLEINYKEYL